MSNLQLSPQQAAQELLQRRHARKNLLTFTKRVFEGFNIGPHHVYLIKKLEEVERAVREKKGSRLLVTMPPRHTKSELCSKLFPAWCFGRNPLWQIITATYSQDFANDFGRDVKRIIGKREYKAIFPSIELDQDIRAAARWNTNKGGIYVAAGVGGAITGRGAHLAIIDDPFKDWEAAFSAATRESIWRWYMSVLRLRLMPGGAIIVIQTRWHDEDLVGKLLAQEASGGEKWDSVSFPAIAEKDDALGREVGEPLWPAWFPHKALMQIKSVLPPYEWSALYQQKPVPDEGEFFKRDWVQWYDTKPATLRICITHDDAVSRDTGDYTELAVWGVDDRGDVYALDWYSDQQSPDVWIDVLVNFMRDYKPISVVGEGGVIRRAVEPFLLRRMLDRKVFCNLTWLPSINDKVSRASSFRGLMSMGKVFFPRGVDWATSLVAQLLRFPAGKHDDKVDACSLLGRVIHKIAAAKVKVAEVVDPIDKALTYRQLLDKAIKDSKHQGRRGRI